MPSLDGQNRQSPIASVHRTRSTLAGHSAVPHGNRAIRIAAQRTQGLCGLILHFPNLPCTQTCLPTWYQVRFFFTFSGGKGLSLVRSHCTSWEALRNKNLGIQTCLRGWYQVRFYGLILGHSWGNGEGPGWHLVRYRC